MSVDPPKPSVFKPLIKSTQAKEIVVKSRLPEAPYVANPYTGCQMGCLYCYAAFMKRWSGHADDVWGTFVDVKENSPDLVDLHRHGEKHILFSSVTDSYQPQEGRFKLTRRIMMKLAAQVPQPSIEILTKSYLVTRDIDVLKRFEHCTVGFSFSTLDDSVRRVIEPGTPVIKQRMAAVQNVHAAGIRTYAFISPILPYLTNIDGLVHALHPFVDFFMFENLNIRPYLWSLLKSGLEKLDPALVARYQEIYFVKGGHARYWNPVEATIREMAERKRFEAKFFFHHL